MVSPDFTIVYTLPKFNIAPEKLPPIGKQSSNHHFSGGYVELRGCSCGTITIRSRDEVGSHHNRHTIFNFQRKFLLEQNHKLLEDSVYIRLVFLVSFHCHRVKVSYISHKKSETCKSEKKHLWYFCRYVSAGSLWIQLTIVWFILCRREQLQELKFCNFNISKRSQRKARSAPWANVRSPSCPESHRKTAGLSLWVCGGGWLSAGYETLGALIFPSLTSGLLKG